MKSISKLVTNDLNKIFKGLHKAADIVVSTMGGAGKNVIIAFNNEEIIFTKDGVSVAKSIRFEDPEENVGAQLLINAAKKTVSEHGDGTTLTSLFTKEFALNCYETILNNPDIDINDFIDRLKEEIEIVKQKLRETSKKIENNSDIYKIAYTSSKSPRIGNFIAEIYSKTGLKANIGIEKSRTSNSTYYELVKGLSFDSGFVHQGFSNNENGNCYFENPFIFITNDSITVPSDYEEIINYNFKNNTPIVFIAPTFSDAFVRYAYSNKVNAGLEICLIKFPGWGNAVNENLKDIKAFINSNGTCSSVKVTPVEFTIYNDPEPEKLKKRVSQLKALAENAIDGYDEEMYNFRLASIQQSSAIIYVGGFTEKNAKEEYDRIEDAVGAVKSAIKGGYVKGAGLELYNIVNLSSELYKQEIIKTCQRPFIQILENARITVDSIKNRDLPYNLRTKSYDSNIIDSTEMICSALDNSFALVELLINTSYLVHNVESTT